MIKFISWVYSKFTHREAPRGLRQNSLPRLIWKIIRKWLCVAVIPLCPINLLRIWGYRLIGFKIGKQVFIGMQCYLDDFCPSDMIIEDDVYVSYRVVFAAHGPRMHKRSLILRKGCYIGANSTVLGGVTIGYYGTVGACSLVNKDVPAFTTVGGVPCRVIRTDRTPWESEDNRLEELKKKYLS